MKPVPTDRLDRVRPLFAAFPGMHGAIDAVLDGLHGEVSADDPDAPRVARITIGDFQCFAGDPAVPAVSEALLAVPFRDYLAADDSWHDTVMSTIPAVFPYDRFAFSAPDEWDRAHIGALVASLPPDYTMERITAQTVKDFAHLNETFVANFKSHGDFLDRGIGFGVRHRGRKGFVAGCSTYTISNGQLEFEIETDREYQRRGLALVTGARMVQHCLETGLEPCWDAAHEGSALLAERLGFVGRRRYTAYRVGIPSGPPGTDA